MANIVRATTPTIKYAFKTVDVTDITAAYLTIMQDGEVLIEKDLTAATVVRTETDNYLSWTFTQAETLQMETGKITSMLNWLLDDGTRGASPKSTLIIEGNYKDEVI